MSMTVRKSRYLRLSAAPFARSLTAGDNPQINSRIGADEMTFSASIVCNPPCRSVNSTVQVLEASWYEQPVTLQPVSIVPPIAFVFSAHASHIILGPLL